MALKSNELPDGYVYASDGSITHHSRLATARDPGATSERSEAATNSQLPHSQQEELQNVDNETAERETPEAAAFDYQAGLSSLDGEGGGEFDIAITLNVSNRMRRDPTGAFETICDLITLVRRRLSERLGIGELESKPSAPRRRRRNNNNNKAHVEKGPVPF